MHLYMMKRKYLCTAIYNPQHHSGGTREMWTCCYFAVGLCSASQKFCGRSSGGMLTDEEQERAVSICITLLGFLKQWIKVATPDPKDTTRSNPASHARAVLQLLARLTKKHSLAQKVCPTPS
jgi:hypothetical protein